MLTLVEIRANCVLDMGCWRWMGELHKGYPVVRVSAAQASVWGVPRGRRLRVYHMAFRHRHGPIPEGLLHLHTCSHSWCTNPDHLYAGTQKDNARDRRAAGNEVKPPSWLGRHLSAEHRRNLSESLKRAHKRGAFK